MADELHNYRIKENMLKKSFLHGFTVEGSNKLACVHADSRHVFISCAVDGAQEECKWGRLWFDAAISEDTVLTVYAMAVDEKSYDSYFLSDDISISGKRKVFENAEAVKAVNQTDLLLYSQRGRYLYIMIDVMGEGIADISNLQVNNKGDIIMQTLPEVYHEYGSFFHRYLSVFSSLYRDFQNQIDYVDRLLDVDEAPVKLLPVLAQWMGIDVSGDFLDGDKLRTLVKEAYQLNKMKGTRTALERLTEIILGEKAIILEKNVFRDYSQNLDTKTYESLYGDRPYDVTLLIKTYVPESQKSQLMFLLNQFKPVRCRLLIYFLDARGELDNHTYLDMNAQIQDLSVGSLDHNISLDAMALFDE